MTTRLDYVDGQWVEVVTMQEFRPGRGSSDTQVPSLFDVPMGQWWQDLQIWEWFLNDHSEIKEIVELGTSTGGFALFLALQAVARGLSFKTYDIGDLQHNQLTDLYVAPCFVMGDVFGPAGHEVLARMDATERPRMIVFCDNGDKRREYKLFAPHLRDGDFLAVHDWWLDPTGEFGPPDIDNELTETVWADICDAHDSHTRFFQRRQT